MKIVSGMRIDPTKRSIKDIQCRCSIVYELGLFYKGSKILHKASELYIVVVYGWFERFCRVLGFFDAWVVEYSISVSASAARGKLSRNCREKETATDFVPRMKSFRVRPDGKRTVSSDAWLHFLQTVPGVSESKAQKIMDYYPTIDTLLRVYLDPSLSASIKEHLLQVCNRIF